MLDILQYYDGMIGAGGDNRPAPLFIHDEWVYMNRSIGSFPKLVHVPTHFFKVVLARRASPPGGSSSYQAAGAFLVPNVNTVDSKVCGQYLIKQG